MANPGLRIGVLTLCPGDEAQLDPALPLASQLGGLIAQGALTYTVSPDDWVPFNDGTTILRHLTTRLTQFTVSSGSAGLRDFKTRRDIKLFVIDPVVLLHPEKARLADIIQEHVCISEKKALCIVIPRGGLPTQFYADLFDYYQNELSDLVNNAGGFLVEARIDDLFRLDQFLKKAGPLLDDVPDASQHTTVQQFFNTMSGVDQARGIRNVPSLFRGARR